MKRQELALLLGVTLILMFISVSYLRQYLYLVMGVFGLVGIANTIYFLTKRFTTRVQSAYVFGTLSTLSLFLSWYLWKKPLSNISIWLIGGLLLGALLGVSILHLVRIKK
jgi:drug/metabolite transporter (DMT)-like permease